MGTTKFKDITARAGLRWEETNTEASEADTRTPTEVRAAGFPVSAAGIATTIPGIQYQFLSQPRVKRTGNYDNLFPSASLKYNVARNFDVHFGYSSTIRRPSYVNLAGVWIVNETALTVTSPNPGLKPETSETTPPASPITSNPSASSPPPSPSASSRISLSPTGSPRRNSATPATTSC